MDHEGDGDTNSNWCTRNDHLRFDKRAGRVKNLRMIGDHQNYIIVEIGQKYWEESWRLEETCCHLLIAEWQKKCCSSQRNLGSICCSLFSLQLTSNTQPFRIKCERYIFLKKCVRSSLLLTMFPCIMVMAIQHNINCFRVI